jgi:hypothetical protein
MRPGARSIEPERDVPASTASPAVPARGRPRAEILRLTDVSHHSPRYRVGDAPTARSARLQFPSVTRRRPAGPTVRSSSNEMSRTVEVLCPIKLGRDAHARACSRRRAPREPTCSPRLRAKGRCRAGSAPRSYATGAGVSDLRDRRNAADSRTRILCPADPARGRSGGARLLVSQASRRRTEEDCRRVRGSDRARPGWPPRGD